MKTPKKNNWHSIRIKTETNLAAQRISKKVNNKTLGRKVKIDDIINLALLLLTDYHIKQLRFNALSNEDRKEQLRRVYIKKFGKITKDEFTGFMLKPEFSDFIKETKQDQLV